MKELTFEIQQVVPHVESWHIVKSALQNLKIVKKGFSSEGIKYQIDLVKVWEKAREKGIRLEINEEELVSEKEVFK